MWSKRSNHTASASLNRATSTLKAQHGDYSLEGFVSSRGLRGKESSAADATVCRFFRIVGGHENGLSCLFVVFTWYTVSYTEAAKIYCYCYAFFRVTKLDTETGQALLAFGPRAQVTQHQRHSTLATNTLRAMATTAFKVGAISCSVGRGTIGGGCCCVQTLSCGLS